jgi:DNA polymerase V
LLDGAGFHKFCREARPSGWRIGHPVTNGFTLPRATSDTAELIAHAVRGLRLIFRPGFHYAKCGVILAELSATSREQVDLFAAGDADRRQQQMKTVDGINRRMGGDTVSYAGSGLRREWLATASIKSRHVPAAFDHTLVIAVA